MANEPLITKYRPINFDTIIGHGEMMASLIRAMTGETCPHTYLLTGPSGIGKTTIARIIADTLEAEILEIDAATNNGVEATREIVNLGNHMAISGAGKRGIIIDECHALSKAAWQPLLKLLEEPPEHLYIFLCTTERGKVPETIFTRCFDIVLKPLRRDEIEELLLFVCEQEEMTPEPDIFNLIVQMATGQPRKALSLLEKVWDAPTLEEARRIISLQDGSDDMIELIKYLMASGKDWNRVKGYLSNLEADDWEAGLIGAGRYIMAVMLSSKDEKGARQCWELLEAITYPAQSFDKRAVFFAAVGRMIWS